MLARKQGATTAAMNGDHPHHQHGSFDIVNVSVDLKTYLIFDKIYHLGSITFQKPHLPKKYLSCSTQCIEGGHGEGRWGEVTQVLSFQWRLKASKPCYC